VDLVLVAVLVVLVNLNLVNLDDLDSLLRLHALPPVSKGCCPSGQFAKGTPTEGRTLNGCVTIR